MSPTTDSERKREELIAEQAAEWLARLRTPEPRDRLAFLKWLKESPLHVRELLIATTWDRMLIHLDPECCVDIQDLMNGASSNVVAVRPSTGIPVTPTSQHARTHRPFRWPWLVGLGGTAAALLLLAMNLIDPQQFKTAVGEQRAFELADGSIIHLNTQSAVQVDFSAGVRDVYLRQGQVIFKVKHDAARPFRVHAGNTVIQAIGTQFDVYRLAERTDVAVIEGAVQILSSPTEEHLSQLAERTRISGGQLVSIVADGAVTPPAPVNVANVNAWQQRRLIFRRHTLQEIADEFNRYNRRLQIRVEGDDLRSSRFSGVFDADDPESLLKYLEADGRFAFERDGDELVIRAQRQEAPHSPASETI